MSKKSENIFSLDDVDDLPAELKDELSAFRRDKNEQRIIDLLVRAKRPLNIDEFIVGFYRAYGEEKNRRYMTIKLYNMSRSQIPEIVSVPKRKGVYALRKSQDY